MKNNL